MSTERFMRLGILATSLAVFAIGFHAAADSRADNDGLQARLDARSQQSAKKAPEERRRIFQRGIDDLRDSGIVEKAVDVGDSAPAFTLPADSGESISLGALLEKGPVVIVWYRGGWCPYCSMTLRAYEEAFPDIREQGASLVAISPELSARAAATADENALSFPLLIDADNAVARRYGVVFTVPPDVMKEYDKFFDLSDYNGNEKNELPLAATYVIGRDGVVKWAFLDADYKRRAEPADVVAALRAL